jgi:hypothetical protein
LAGGVLRKEKTPAEEDITKASEQENLITPITNTSMSGISDYANQ